MDEITALLVRYCELIDAGDFEGIGNLFTHGALMDGDENELARGSDVAKFYRNSIRLYGGSPRTKHLVLNVVSSQTATR